MSEKNQFYQLKNIKETKQVSADNPKFRTVYFSLMSVRDYLNIVIMAMLRFTSLKVRLV